MLEAVSEAPIPFSNQHYYTFLCETQTGAFLRSSVINLNLHDAISFDVQLSFSPEGNQVDFTVSSQSVY